jgi:hypothetical protein
MLDVEAEAGEATEAEVAAVVVGEDGDVEAADPRLVTIVVR